MILQEVVDLMEIGLMATKRPNYKGMKVLELGNQRMKWNVHQTGKNYLLALGIEEHVSIDLNGKAGALRIDLSKPLPSKWHNYFDMTTNFGTAEHVENGIYECFKSIHDVTKIGGIFVHDGPPCTCCSWHSPYHYEPWFFKKLAEVAGYDHIMSTVRVVQGRRRNQDPKDRSLVCSVLIKKSENFITKQQFIDINGISGLSEEYKKSPPNVYLIHLLLQLLIMNIPKRAFIRVLWGTDSDKTQDDGWITPSGRRTKIDWEINSVLNNPYTAPFTTYVFGKNNYDKIKSYGLECKLINDQPSIYDLQLEFWRHKLDLLSAAMEDYDQIVYLDWDCEPTKKLPSDFWDILDRKESIQANLCFYRRNKNYWRAQNKRKVSNGGFIYMRDRLLPSALQKTYDSLDKDHRFWDEVAISKLIDDKMGGFDLDTYWRLFEPEVCNLKKKSAFSDEQVLSKDISYMHFIQSVKRRDFQYTTGLS